MYLAISFHEPILLMSCLDSIFLNSWPLICFSQLGASPLSSIIAIQVNRQYENMLISSLTYTCELWSVYHTILVVEEWNGLESSHPRFPCSVNLGFWKIFKLKHSFAPQMILSDRSMCIVLCQSIVLSLLILLLKSLCGVLGRDKICSVLTLHIL